MGPWTPSRGPRGAHARPRGSVGTGLTGRVAVRTGRARGTEQTFSTGIDVAAANNEGALPGRMGNLAPRGVAHPRPS